MHRIERLQEEIQHLVSTTVLFELSDPRLKTVTVTRVVLTKDIGIARVYYELPGTEAEKTAAYQSLRKAKNFIRKKLASELRIKQVPDIEFYYDQTKESISRVEALLSKL